MNNGDNMNTHATQTEKQTQNTYAQIKQTNQTEKMAKLMKLTQRKINLLDQWGGAILALRDYVDWLDGTDQHPKRDPSAFFAVADMAEELKGLGEWLNNISLQFEKLEQEFNELGDINKLYNQDIENKE